MSRKGEHREASIASRRSSELEPAAGAFTADVTNGDVHVELRGRGEIELAGDIVGGPAKQVTASGRHLVLMKGGVGIRTRP